LLLHFAPAGTVRSETKPIDPTFVPGTAFDGTLVFFPSEAPLRAIVKERTAAVEWPSDIGYADISEAVTATVAADARMPWLEGQPVLLRDATPTTLTPAQVRDATGRAMALSTRFRERWRLLAVSGGSPVPVFGEWDGETLTPLTVWGESGAVLLA
jgi:hypothetical protein